MSPNTPRRKRKRKPTLGGRFSNSSLALEIGLIRMTIDLQRELERKEQQKEESK